MSEPTDYVVYAATYNDTESAVDDFASLREAGLKHITAAVVVKDDNGRVHVHEKTNAGKVAGTVGVIGGAALGVIFPPAGAAVLADAVVGGAVLGTIGHFAGGLSRHDLKELGAMLEEGQAAVVAVGVDEVGTDIDRTLSRAARKASKSLDKGDVEGALEELAKGADKAADKATEDLV